MCEREGESMYGVGTRTHTLAKNVLNQKLSARTFYGEKVDKRDAKKYFCLKRKNKTGID